MGDYFKQKSYAISHRETSSRFELILKTLFLLHSEYETSERELIKVEWNGMKLSRMRMEWNEIKKKRMWWNANAKKQNANGMYKQNTSQRM